MATHNLLDGLARLIGIVEGDGADVVVEDMGFDDSVQQLTSDETELPVNCRSSSASVRP